MIESEKTVKYINVAFHRTHFSRLHITFYTLTAQKPCRRGHEVDVIVQQTDYVCIYSVWKLSKSFFKGTKVRFYSVVMYFSYKQDIIQKMAVKN